MLHDAIIVDTTDLLPFCSLFRKMHEANQVYLFEQKAAQATVTKKAKGADDIALELYVPRYVLTRQKYTRFILQDDAWKQIFDQSTSTSPCAQTIRVAHTNRMWELLGSHCELGATKAWS